MELPKLDLAISNKVDISTGAKTFSTANKGGSITGGMGAENSVLANYTPYILVGLLVLGVGAFIFVRR